MISNSEIPNPKSEISNFETPFDAIIIGAGIAGTVAANTLAQRGYRTLLLEKSPWPREKACGGCLNAAGIHLLQTAGLANVLHDAAPLTRMQLHSGHRTASFSLPPGAVVERHLLDARLAAEAVARGTTFLPQSPARLLPDDNPNFRTVQIAGTTLARAPLILACDGLGKTGTGFLAAEPWASVRVAPRGRLGFSATISAQDWNLPPGTLLMCVGPEGYVGIVQLPPNPDAPAQLHIGAALLPEACHAHRGPAPVIQKILRACGHTPADSLASAPFVGTGILTRQRPTVGRGRVLALGDATGYVEPFTGEGMAWAIRAALAACQLLPNRPQDITPDIGNQWQRRFESQLLPRQKWCRGLRHLLAHQPLTSLGITAARLLPSAARQLARHISAG